MPDSTWEIQGRRGTFPVRIADASMAVAVYAIPRAPVDALLSGTPLVPISFRGHTLLSLLFVDYRQNDLGDYDEVGVALPVRGPDHRIGIYVHQLPVSQTFTMPGSTTARWFS